MSRRTGNPFAFPHRPYPPDPSWWEQLLARRARRRIAVAVLYGLATGLLTAASAIAHSWPVSYMNSSALFFCLTGLSISARRRP
jgi:hypothetical protein